MAHEYVIRNGLQLTDTAVGSTETDVLVVDSDGVVKSIDITSLVPTGTGGIYGGSGTVPTTTAVTVTDTLNFDSDTLVIHGTNNTVGIGVAVPTGKFSIVNSTEDVTQTITNSYTGATNKIGLQIDVTGTGGSSTTYGIDMAVAGASASNHGIDIVLSSTGVTNHGISTVASGAGTNNVGITGNATGASGQNYGVVGVGGGNGFSSSAIDAGVVAQLKGTRSGSAALWIYNLSQTTGTSNGILIDDFFGHASQSAYAIKINQGNANLNNYGIQIAVTGASGTNRALNITSGETLISDDIRFNGLTTTPATGYVLQSTDALGNLDWVNPSTLATTDTHIGSDDLTIDSAGTRKLIMAGALGTDKFVIRNSADSADIFSVSGNSQIYLNDVVYVGYSGSSQGALKVYGNAGSSSQITNFYNSTGIVVYEFRQSVGHALAYFKNATGTVQLTINASTGGSIFTLNDSKNITFGTTTGTKIGTSTTEKLAFYNATPVVQPTAVTTAQGIADALTTLGLLASSTVTGDGDGIYDGSGTVPTTTAVTVTDTLNFDSNTLVIDATNNRVGVGTVAPATALDVTGTITTDNIINAGTYSTNNSSTRDKIRVWSTSAYTIGMQNSITFGNIDTEYAMTFQMNSVAGRGFWWGSDSHTTAQGAMALGTDGNLTVATGIRVGYGTSDTTLNTVTLDVSGATRIAGLTTTPVAGYVLQSTDANGNTDWMDLDDSHTHDTQYVKKSNNPITTDPDLMFTQSMYRFDPHVNLPTNAHHAVMTYGNGSNVTGQIATHFTNGKTYARAYNTSWTSWKELTSTTGTVTSVTSANGDATVATTTTTPVITIVSAPKWTTARTITLGGDLTGNTSIDGSGNVTLTATIATGSGGIYEGSGTVPTATAVEITDTLTFNTGTIKLPNISDNSLTDAALWLNGSSGALMMDNNAQRRITWNDGGGNFNIWSGGYYNAANKYVNAGDGVAKMVMTTDAQDGNINFYTAVTGVAADDVITFANHVKITTLETVFNEAGNGINFRVESDNNINMLFVDGGLDRLGIKTGTPSATLDVNGSTRLRNLTTTPAAGYVLQSTDALGNLDFVDPDTLGIDTNIGTDDLTIDSTGDRILNMAGALATDTFTIRNSGDTADILRVQGDGIIDMDTGYLNLGDGTNTYGQLYFYNTGGHSHYIQSYSNQFYLNGASSLNFRTGGGNRAQFTSTQLYFYDTINLAFGTTTGTKIGTSTTQKLAFYNATPVVQPTAVTTVQGLATALTTLGLLATSTIGNAGTGIYGGSGTVPTTTTATITDTFDLLVTNKSSISLDGYNLRLTTDGDDGTSYGWMILGTTTAKIGFGNSGTLNNGWMQALATNASIGFSLNYGRFTSTETVMNIGGGDYDFRVRGNSEDNLLFVDAGNDRVAIGTNSTSSRFEVTSPTSTNTNVRISATTADPSLLFTTIGQQDWCVGIDYSDSGKFKIGENSVVGTTTRLTIDSSGNVGINDTTPTHLLDVNGSFRATGEGAFDDQLTTKGRIHNVTQITAASTLTATAEIVFITPGGKTGSYTVNMPASPATGQRHTIYRKYNATLYTTTLSGNGNNFFSKGVSYSTRTLVNDWIMDVVYDGTYWYVLKHGLAY